MSAHDEKDLFERHGGYLSAASWLARDPDNETFIFRKFDRLAALNLLYMQSEILELEKRLSDQHLDVARGHDMDLKDAASTWETLTSQFRSGRPDAGERMKLILELREKLKTYHETLLLQSQVAQLHHPENRVLAAVKHFFERPHHILGGKAKNFLNSPIDLVVLKAPAEVDYLSNVLRRYWASEKEETRDGVNHFARFNERSISITVTIINIILAACFLIGPIVGLNFSRSPTAKLVMISLFTAFFALSLGLITNAKRAEIFGASAAYAAVLVVFVSNNEFSPDSKAS
ncbi:hypothetical protein F4778DRAFT_350218 [Xylariomycetidae sp. FL2044]|nr:hypothetical protein F4778DRAFT_350218 [Xylariomycetidae sp. FL2044]